MPIIMLPEDLRSQVLHDVPVAVAVCQGFNLNILLYY